MKFRETSNWNVRTYGSHEEYFDAHASDNLSLTYGEMETLRQRVAFLESIVGRLLNHIPLSLDQLSDVVIGYDSGLEEIEE